MALVWLNLVLKTARNKNLIRKNDFIIILYFRVISSMVAISVPGFSVEDILPECFESLKTKEIKET